MTTFDTQTEALFDTLVSHIEAQVPDCIHDQTEGRLTLTLPDNSCYLLHQNNVLQQIWLSSPVSGAHHYTYDRVRGAWVSVRNQEDILEVRLLTELKHRPQTLPT